jgi:hypothetical protein
MSGIDDDHTQFTALSSLLTCHLNLPEKIVDSVLDICNKWDVDESRACVLASIKILMLWSDHVTYTPTEDKKHTSESQFRSKRIPRTRVPMDSITQLLTKHMYNSILAYGKIRQQNNITNAAAVLPQTAVDYLNKRDPALLKYLIQPINSTQPRVQYARENKPSYFSGRTIWF